MEAVRILQVICLQTSDEAVCVFFCRSPASGQADNGMVGIVGFPAAEGDGMA